MGVVAGTAWSLRRGLAAGVVVAFLLAACAPYPKPDSRSASNLPQASPPSASQPVRTITIGVTSTVSAMSIAADSSTAGGWHHISEIHSIGLMTSDVHSPRPVGRIAERAPSLDDGSIAVLPDGRMRVVYHLRRDVTWHDGTPFTSRDAAFAFDLGTDRGLPALDRRAIGEMESAEAPDPYTFVINFKAPYYAGGQLGARDFWLHPYHLLHEPYARYQASKDANDFLNLQYWTTEYVHLGPFRLAEFDPGEGVAFEAYGQYFLGRPKVDAVRVRTFGDQSALFSNLLAGTVDMFPVAALGPTNGSQLKELWDRSGQGTIYAVVANTWYLTPQHRPWVQAEPANLDPKMRAALYQAIDRETLAEALLGAKELAAYSMIPSGFLGHEATRDGLRPYGYSPERARALLRDAGWVAGPDGGQRHVGDGRRYRTALWTTPGENIAAIADYWRRIGIEVDEHILSTPQARDRQFRSHFPGWEASGRSVGPEFVTLLKGPVTSAENSWSGNRAGYDDLRAERLVNAFYRAVGDQEQSLTMRAISEFVAAELPLLPLYHTPRHLGARAGIKALEDIAGSEGGPGTSVRNIHLWEVL